MASSLRAVRCLRVSRPVCPRSRFISTSRPCRNEADVGVPATQTKPIGAFRGGIVGFLAGFSLAASVAAYNLLDEYQLASAALQASVEELQLSTEKISSHVRRIEAVEKDLKALGGTSASKDDLSKLRAEVKKIYDGLHVEFLDLRSHVWGMQQDIHSLSKKDTTSVRI
ncbi:hypothetical protein DFH08DRAFT_835506 [Mycena albidolilacea]|uniref:IncA domain-containing protein n=1 Tax=Mycena albidolilacea TaxID=1033008 RepID=A0AAD7F2W9_9AGAR|nr:hypothetical protein DFH08DRAFT_835506 [Mycena albidolilacea]